MELSNQQTINAPLQTVYDALNDPEILRQSIPGCETIEKTSPTDMQATVTLKIGPIKARFNGDLQISDLNPPTDYKLTFSGKGGSAGDARGSASVHLEAESETATVVNYQVNADVSGKIAQVGGRLINSTANVLAKKFFKRFGEIVEGDG